MNTHLENSKLRSKYAIPVFPHQKCIVVVVGLQKLESRAHWLGIFHYIGSYFVLHVFVMQCTYGYLSANNNYSIYM